MEETYIKDKESIGVELLHYINSLIEPLADESIDIVKVNECNAQNELNFEGRKSITKAEKNSKPNQTWVVGVDAIDDLRDIIKLIKREIEGGADSERYAITMLCEWNVVNTKLMPLWNISTNNIEIQSLIIQVLFWLTVAPDESWRSFHSKSMKCKAYLKNMQKVKFSLCSISFWKEIVILYRKLKEVIQNHGFLKEDNEDLRNREEQIAFLKDQDKEQGEEVTQKGHEHESKDLVDEQDETDENDRHKMQRLERLEMIRNLRDEIIMINEKAERRLKQYKNRIGMIKGLLIQTLKIQDQVVTESLANFGVRSVHLLLVSNLVQSGILEIIQDDSESLLNDLKGEYVIDDSDVVAPWRILEYIYGLICNIQPIDFVNELFGIKRNLTENEILKNSLVEKMKLIKKSSSSGFTSNSLMNRHSRFNPELARRRIKENNGGTTGQVVNSKRVSSQRVSKYRYDFDIDEIYEYIDIFIGAMQSAGGTLHCLEMYGYPTIEGTMANFDGNRSQSYDETVQILGEFLENFFKLKLPALIEKIFIILRSGSEKHTLWDISRLISLMTWVLAYKRTVFFEVTKNEKDKQLIKEELTRLLMETKYLLDTKENMAIDFIYSTIKLHARERLLKNKSHKVARIAIRCLNEQLKIIHLVSNSEEEAIRDLGISLIAFIIRLDIMNCLSWILKHYTKTSHHPELFLYSIEVSNRLIKLFSKLGGETLVSTRRRRRDKPTDIKDYNDEEDYNLDENLSGFNENYYTEKTKLMSLDEMMSDYCDGRVVSNLMLIVNNYSTNHSNINWHTARLARKIITTRPQGEVSILREDGQQEPFMQLFCGLFFQLSYFITFTQILSDKSFLNSSKSDKGAQDIVLLSRHVIHQFWEIAKVNQFVFMELLFSKNSARGLGLADPERLKSIFTNYEQGIDAAIVERMETTGNEDVFEAKSFVKNKINKEKQAVSNWSKEDDEELLALYTQFEENPKCISIIASLLTDVKTERSVKKRLRELGKILIQDDLKDQDEEENRTRTIINVDLISGILGLSNACPEDIIEEGLTFDSSIVLKELLDLLQESLSTKEIFGDNQFEEIPIEIPSSLPTSLLDDQNYKLIMSSLGLKKPGKDENLWVVPKELSIEEYNGTINLFRDYIEKDIFELTEMMNSISNFVSNNCQSEIKNINYSIKILKNTIQDFIEDSELSGEISHLIDQQVPVENGLLHLISSELKVIIEKNNHANNWERMELDNICLCLSQLRLNSLGIRKQFEKIYESFTMSKLLHLLGFKKSRITNDTDFLVHLDRGITKDHLDLSERGNNNQVSLFDDELDDHLIGNDCLNDSSIKVWVLDYERITLTEFKERSKLFRELVIEMADIKANISKDLNRNNTFSKKTISKLCLGIYNFRRNTQDLKIPNRIIAVLDKYLIQQQDQNDYDDDDKYIVQIEKEDLINVEEYINQIMESLKGQKDNNCNWSIRNCILSYTYDRIKELRELLFKLIGLEMAELKIFTEKVIGKKIKVNKENIKSMNQSNKRRKVKVFMDEKNEDEVVDSDRIEYEIEDEIEDQVEDGIEDQIENEVEDGITKYIIDENDKKWRYDWENLEKKMLSVGDECLFSKENEDFGRIDKVLDELFGEDE
ncbi:SANT domain-containing protein [Cryptosporidium ubiquitum]|uniref:SANT domain-containing protein n=1 Tax=Cryptosporidium ubiquitum TaxID=857276 RepID=A0A1J4MH25_9CRYT|nr:SANT domain-containing protein [Cryptosporidium ubiquitum]OII72763.1 SANT domain-containing protein [Cryptosporidium ubiquitum]